MLVENISTLKCSFIQSQTTHKVINVVLKVLAIIALICYCSQFFIKFAIDVKQLMPLTESLIVNFLRWFTLITTGVCIISPWFGNKYTRLFAAIFGIVVGIMNLIYYNQNMIAFGMDRVGHEGEFSAAKGYAYMPWRVILWTILQGVFILEGFLSGFQFFYKKEYVKFKPHYFIFIIIGFGLTFFYCYLPQNLSTLLHFKLPDEKPLNFSVSHIIYLLMNLVLLIGLLVIFKNRNKEDKKLLLVTMSISAMFNFFYEAFYYGGNSYNWDLIPVHICNAATILLTIAYVFELKSIFYFTLFVNVLGTIFAMLMPNIETTALSYSTLRFWYNHIYAFVLPILGLCLKMFDRPKLKNALMAVLVFTIYFLYAAFMNALVSNWYPQISYFFMNDDFFLKKLVDISGGALKLEDMHKLFFEDVVLSFKIGDLTFNFYPLYHLIIYSTFVLLMFILWFIYDVFFHVSDAHVALHERKIIIKDDYAKLKKLLNGRSLKEPLCQEGIGMIEIKHFTKVYAGSDKPSVDDLNLTIKDGEVYGFLGHNGAGKSTTIKSIVGIQTITNGQIIVDGYDVAKQPVEAKLRIGYVSDNHAVYEKLTGREYINYIADLYMVPQNERDERIDKYVTMFKLNDAIDREIKSYSHGMKQKIVVIASLIHNPKVWILDEPLTGLDPTSAFQIKECMREHASRGNIVFFSSHVIEVVEKICTKICIIGHGKLMCEYSLKELKDKGISLEELYLKYVSNEERIN